MTWIALTQRGALALFGFTLAGCPEPEDELDDGTPLESSATSDGDDASGELPPGASADDPPVPGSFEADVVLRNRVALDMPILIRRLAEDIECEWVAEDPGGRLRSEQFEPGETVTFSPHEMVALWPHEPGERPCYAVWVQTEGLGERIVLWPDGEPPVRFVAPTCCEVGPGVVELMPVDNGWSLDLLGNEHLVHEPG